MSQLTPDDRKDLRGHILRYIKALSPREVAETTLRRNLYKIGIALPDDELVNEIKYLRNRGFITSRSISDPADRALLHWFHELTPDGYELVNGETEDAHVRVL